MSHTIISFVPRLVISYDNLNELRSLAEKLFTDGTESTMFARRINLELSTLSNQEIKTDDDFYNLSSEGNKHIRRFLNLLGFRYTKQGISVYNPQIGDRVDCEKIRHDEYDVNYCMRNAYVHNILENGKLYHLRIDEQTTSDGLYNGHYYKSAYWISEVE